MTAKFNTMAGNFSFLEADGEGMEGGGFEMAGIRNRWEKKICS